MKSRGRRTCLTQEVVKFAKNCTGSTGLLKVVAAVDGDRCFMVLRR